MHITIIAVGKFKEKYWRQAEEEYFKRLAPYAKIEVIELKEEAFRDGDVRERIKEAEAKQILKHLKESDTLIALHERGMEMDSVGLAEFLGKRTEQGQHLTFIIGGPLGLDESLLEHIPYHLSLSQLTFPHQMVRVILAEQLYRAVTIMKGKQYHY